MPKFSVIIPTYNRANFISECVNSVLQQSELDYEIIIVDDFSSDTTQRELIKFQDPRIKKIRTKENLGRSSARNLAISVANSKYIAILDSDDIMYPKRLELQGNFLDKNPDFVLVGGVLDGHEENKHQVKVLENIDVRLNLILGNLYDHSSILFRKSALNRVKGPYKNKNYEDYFLYSDLILSGKFGFLQKPVGKYNYHYNQISNQKFQNGESEIQQIKRRIILKCLIARLLFCELKNSNIRKVDLLAIWTPKVFYRSIMSLRENL